MTTTVPPGHGAGPDFRVDADAVTAERAWSLAPMIAGRARVRVGVRTGRPGEFTYPQRAERPLTAALPSAPAAVRLADKHGCIHTLCLDLDVGRHGAQQVEADRRTLSAWLDSFGAKYVTDRSPSGGHHIYVPLAGPVPYRDAWEVVRALRSIAPSLDPSVFNSVHGCIRPPGARWKHGGYQLLLGDIDEASFILSTRNAESLWLSMWSSLEQERHELGTNEPAAPEPEATQAAAGVSTTRPFFARLEAVAREGTTEAYKSRSEARMAVLVGAARIGMRFQDVVARVEDGRWAGLASFYAKYTGTVARRRLASEWNKAHRFLAANGLKQPPPTHRESHGRISYTSPAGSHAPTRETRSHREFILQWLAAADRQLTAHSASSRQARSARWVARALAEAAVKSGGENVAFGVRSLAVAAGMSHTSVATHLKWLRSLPDPPVVLDRVGRLEHADTYLLVIPDEFCPTVPPRGRRRVFALRPAFRALGHVAAEIFEAVEDGRADSAVSASLVCRMSLTAAREATDILLSYGLLTRAAGRLVARPGRLPTLAEYLGAHIELRDQVEAYRLQRRAWHAYLEWLLAHPLGGQLESHGSHCPEPSASVLANALTQGRRHSGGCPQAADTAPSHRPTMGQTNRCAALPTR
ncbi:hypothetical protein KZX45_08430 [Georgenia sp. EYE_87]|uniref:hypothetical protein n=1 Tax=Georgenia sp. EYE_87 TaxID=2853448 RepID=UPI002002EC3F|nr:hypothetical protein [Georgenia sp. EYE_87]MCK6210568.1 hypothetical protein [Georgenia sp. EYE_87]